MRAHSAPDQIASPFVIAGLDPAIHGAWQPHGHAVKPAHDASQERKPMTSHKPGIATVPPPTLEKQLGVLAAARSLATQDDEFWRRRRAEIAALRRELGELVVLRLELQREYGEFVELVQELQRRRDPRLRSHIIKYNPDESRVPAGSAHGGEWTSGGSEDESLAPVTAHGAGRGPQYAQLDTGTQTDASGRKGPISSRDIPADDPKHPVPFVDSNGNPITDDHGNQIVRPADLPPETYIGEGRLSTLGAVIAASEQTEQGEPGPLAGLPVAIATALTPFRQGGSLDAERYQGQYVTDYRDYANIAIGLYMAAAGVDVDDALSIANAYAAIFSHFHEQMDDVYVHLPERDVRDIKRGYELYNSGRFSAEH
jgi:hypothetical protein